MKKLYIKCFNIASKLKNPAIAVACRVFLFFSKRLLYVPERVLEYVDEDTGLIYQDKPSDFRTPNKHYVTRSSKEYEFSKQYRFPILAVRALKFLYKYKSDDARTLHKKFQQRPILLG